MQAAVKSTVLDDYMMTYENYYGITKQDNPEKYDAVVSVYFDAFAAFLHGTACAVRSSTSLRTIRSMSGTWSTVSYPREPCARSI